MEADGIFGYTYENVNIAKLIADMGIPAIAMEIEKATSKILPLTMNHYTIAQLAAEYFVGRSFKHFGYCGFEDFKWSQQRGADFGEVVAKYGFKTFFCRLPKAKQSLAKHKEQTLIARWLGSLPKPIAIMACNDDRSVDVLAACKIANINVPEEVAILGVDNDELVCELSNPQLSSIVLSTKRTGYEAARILDQLMKGQKIAKSEKQVSILPLHIVTRQSTDITAAEDKLVVEAVKFIHSRSKEFIQVIDVAEAIGLSRRGLETRFRRALGRSVLEEINYHRVNQMANMLISTNLSISQISRLLGSSHTGNMSRFFKQQKGINPLEYRRKFGPK